MKMHPNIESVKVKYRLGEYLSILSEYAAYAVAARRLNCKPHEITEKPDPIGWVSEASLRFIATFAFAYKSRRVGECDFSFDPSGISRRSKSGTVHLPWTRVERTYKLSRGYLFAMADGGMPLPYRCLNDDERARLDVLLGQMTVET
jgi:hypothetical protein